MSAPLLVLLGLRCVGKSSLGRALAQQEGWQFCDLDDELARRAAGGPHSSVGELLQTIGLAAFRDEEQRLLAAVAAETRGPCVLATGGGVVERIANREVLSNLACIWLNAPLDVLVKRSEQDSALRPSLTGQTPALEFTQLHESRAPWYRELAGSALELGESQHAAALTLLTQHARERFEHFGEQ